MRQIYTKDTIKKVPRNTLENTVLRYQEDYKSLDKLHDIQTLRAISLSKKVQVMEEERKELITTIEVLKRTR